MAEKEVTVKDLRVQTALMGGDTRVALKTYDPKLREILKRLRIARCYPETVDEHGNWVSTFVIEVVDAEDAR